MSSGDRSRIHILPPELANQVAAGEVVERPASVVKELVENSLDAGAERITIEVQDGGSRLISVCDDGHGIDAEDIAVALQRHATSKIRHAQDLEDIRSLGFRGEALPSIAAVSRFSLCSCTRGASEARRVRVENGMVGEPEPSSHPCGTTAEARDLFYNVPARRKFLRSDQTELTHVQGITRLLGLSRPSVAWRLVHNGRRLLDWRAGDRAGRVAALFGKNFIENSHCVEAVSGETRLSGWFGSVEQARRQPDRQYLFLNDRVMRDRRLNHAVRMGWRSFFADGAHPVYVLFLRMEPGSFDINAHPSKYEVRLRDTRVIHDFISAALRRILSGEGASLFAAPVPPPAGPRPSSGEIRHTLRTYGMMTGRSAVDEKPLGAGFSSPGPARRPVSPGTVRLPGGTDVGGLIDGRLLCVPGPTDLLLIDMRAAWEKLLLRRLTEKKGALTPRPLMIAAKLTTDPACIEALDTWREALADWATEIDQAGPRQIALNTVPVLLDPIDAGIFLAGLAEELLRAPKSGNAATWIPGCLARQGARASVMNSAISEEILRYRNTLKDTGVWRRLDVATLDKWLKPGSK